MAKNDIIYICEVKMNTGEWVLRPEWGCGQCKREAKENTLRTFRRFWGESGISWAYNGYADNHTNRVRFTKRLIAKPKQ